MVATEYPFFNDTQPPLCSTLAAAGGFAELRGDAAWRSFFSGSPGSSDQFPGTLAWGAPRSARGPPPCTRRLHDRARIGRSVGAPSVFYLQNTLDWRMHRLTVQRTPRRGYHNPAALPFFAFMNASLNRRRFIGQAATAGAGLAFGAAAAAAAEKTPGTAPITQRAATAAGRATSAWPISEQRDEDALISVLRSGKWGRTGAGGLRVKEFETIFAERMRARFCVATSSGTTALLSALGALNIGPGDEVILPP